MTLYLDTSALAKLYVDEPDSDAVAAEAAAASILATSILAFPEMSAMLARRRRERLVTKKAAAATLERFRADWARLLDIALDDGLAVEAGRLAAAHGLKGADAVHLASFERVLSAADDDDVRFRCADDRLNRAARRLR